MDGPDNLSGEKSGNPVEKLARLTDIIHQYHLFSSVGWNFVGPLWVKIFIN